jgi:hypothetical protein
MDGCTYWHSLKILQVWLCCFDQSVNYETEDISGRNVQLTAYLRLEPLCLPYTLMALFLRRDEWVTNSVVQLLGAGQDILHLL